MGYFDPCYFKESSQAGREPEGNIWKQELAAESSAKKTKKQAKGSREQHPRQASCSARGGSFWGSFGRTTCRAWGAPRGTNLLRPSSEAELPVTSSASHRAWGTGHKTPLAGSSLPTTCCGAAAVSPIRAVGQLRATHLGNKAAFCSSGAREAHLSQFFRA